MMEVVGLAVTGVVLIQSRISIGVSLVGSLEAETYVV